MRTRIKICGLRREPDVEAAVNSGADAVGFVFEPSSKRYIETEKAKQLIKLIPPFVSKVGVFIEAEPDQLEEYAQGLGLDMVQVHRKPARRPRGVLLIQAMTAGSTLPRNQDCDMVLFDNLEPGSGKPWDWASVKPIAKERRIVLAGGLDPRNVYDAVRIVRPYAVDVSSGVELEPGVKDEGLIREFISQVRRADMEAFK